MPERAGQRLVERDPKENGGRRFRCTYLGGEVELSRERVIHILGRHPELRKDLHSLLARTLLVPDSVRRSRRSADTRLFTRWYPDFHDGKHAVVVVVSRSSPPARHWIVTAYVTRKTRGGQVEWTAS